MPPSTISRRRCRTHGGSWRAGWMRTASTRRSDGRGSTTRLPPLTLRANTLRTTRAALQRRWRCTASSRRPTSVAAGRPGGDAGEPAAARRWPTAVCSCCRTRRRRRLRPCRWRRPGSGCWTRAGRLAARASPWRPRWRQMAVVVAGDIRGRRIDLLRQTLTRMGAASGFYRTDRPQPPAAVRPGVRLVLVDAPCSGLGTIRREPEIRWRRRRPTSLAGRGSAGFSGTRGSRPAWWTPRLHHLLQRARGERGRRGRVPRRNPGVFPGRQRRRCWTGCPTSMGNLIDDAGHLRS